MNDATLAEPGQPGWFAQPGAIVRATAADKGLVERPTLAPHLEWRAVGDDAGLLVSETSSAALYGRRYADLVPLLDGSRSRNEVIAALSGKHSRIEVQTALVSLATKGHVVSADHGLDRRMAAFWTSQRVTPRWAEERLASARITVRGEGGDRLEAALRRMGASVAAEPEGAKSALFVFLARDYLDGSLADANRRHLETGVPWAPVCVRGVWPLVGPVYRPAGGGPCWACVAHRLRGNREVENFVRTAAGEEGARMKNAAPPPFTDAIYDLAALELAVWAVIGEQAALHEHVLSLSAFALGAERHKAMKRPQCSECGDEALYRIDREHAPVCLQSSPKPINNSGGLRSVPPEETVRRYRNLVSPVTGVVTQLVRTTQEADRWLHVYWAGSNLALQSTNLMLLRNSLRTKSSGKGASPQQAEASALCEAVERYSGVFHGDEIRRTARFTDFADGEAIHPNDIQNYSDMQYANAKEINARRYRFNHIPARFDPEVEMAWSPVWSITQNRRRWLPTSMLYFAMPIEKHGKIYTPPDSNGCAAGNTLEEAILQGFFEVVERDAFACWWYNRARIPEVDLDSFGDRYLSDARKYYREHNRELWLLDATVDLRIPAFISISRRTDKKAQDILYAAGAHIDPKIAALRAVCELNQYMSAVRDVKDDGSGYLVDEPESVWWWKNVTLGEYPWLTPDPGARVSTASDYPVPQTADVRDDLEHCRAIVEKHGMEFIVLDQTRPDIGMPVARAIVPGMRHFWARYAPGRLYDVPVRMGWLDKPTAEADMNPIPVFI